MLIPISELLRNIFLFDYRDTKHFTQGRWELDKHGLDPKLDGELSFCYVCYKTIISGYLVAAYFLSHLSYYWQEILPCSHRRSNGTGVYLNTTERLPRTTDPLTLYSRWPYYGLYFSNWCFSLLIISLLIETYLVVRRYIFENKQFDDIIHLEQWTKTRNWGLEHNSEDPHIGTKISWVLSNIVYPLSFVVNALFWVLEYPTMPKLGFDLYCKLNVHLFPSMIVIIDSMASSRPWKVGHFYCCLVFMLIYMFFQVIYVVVFHGQNDKCERFVYSVLDWNADPKLSLAIYSALCGTGIFFHFMLCLLAYLRNRLWNKICQLKEENERKLEMQKISKAHSEQNRDEQYSKQNDNLSTISEEMHI